MKKEEAHTDHGTVLKPDQAALVFDTDGRMSVVLPDMSPDAEIPTGWQLMLAIIQKYNDPDWVAEMVGDRHRPETH
ncbi:hypothetical protein Nham_0597 [Nitrobacter hamburgensis X14]|uniref:Uncharacterized protein n=1 Tax=Nitrobacter hamburgensis (strain DSM 10229 / NCIMB 13809 / X14) TaxID=323097 RepID=Q1QQL1_NITHX|nr:hypothetical protein [Nitrobacter hamburgensis]ABE61486.1 hypothetical protein Nham_0597 [Nitrobacter hamburgensis X14]